jgi:hypothetical protein
MTQLPILAVAFGIYIVGIAIVLYLRPLIMFKPGGSWKEFGIGRGDTHTVIPFWLFAIFWAFMSYGVALVVLSNFANLAISPIGQNSAPVPQMYQQTPTATTAATAPSMTNQTIRPVSSMLGLEKNVPGFYVLSNNGPNPQYVYYGTSPPNASRY